MGVGPSVPLAVPLALVLAVLEAGETMAASYAGRTRKRGGTVLESGELRAFLDMNPEARFDLEAINTIDMQTLLEEARRDERLLRDVRRTTKALLPRVRSETEDATLVVAILRSKTLDWYRRSPSDPRWPERMVVQWGGIFHESRIPGGRLSRKLSSRLESLNMQCIKASGWGGHLRAWAANRLRRSDGSNPPHAPLMQQVAQAYLDELAANVRNGERPLPLERLSELARRVGSVRMNRTLGELFPQDGGGSLKVLDHRFHPEMNTVIIRVVPPKASGDATTYDLVEASASLAHAPSDPDVATAEASHSSPWKREEISKDDWIGLLGSLENRKARLDPPPRENYRNQDSYLGLRELILANSSARSVFLAVHWKGKPMGLVLLSRLLFEGTFAPVVETDGDYLEAELDHIHKGRSRRRPRVGQWKIGHGWTVVRGVSEGSVRTYRAHCKSVD